jgi:hypothetical protein
VSAVRRRPQHRGTQRPAAARAGRCPVALVSRWFCAPSRSGACRRSAAVRVAGRGDGEYSSTASPSHRIHASPARNVPAAVDVPRHRQRPGSLECPISRAQQLSQFGPLQLCMLPQYDGIYPALATPSPRVNLRARDSVFTYTGSWNFIHKPTYGLPTALALPATQRKATRSRLISALPVGLTLGYGHLSWGRPLLILKIPTQVRLSRSMTRPTDYEAPWRSSRLVLTSNNPFCCLDFRPRFSPLVEKFQQKNGVQPPKMMWDARNRLRRTDSAELRGGVPEDQNLRLRMSKHSQCRRAFRVSSPFTFTSSSPIMTTPVYPNMPIRPARTTIYLD